MGRVIVVVATLDSKPEEAEFIVEQLKLRGANPCLMDVGVFGEESRADISRHEVVAAGGGSLDELRDRNERAAALETMARGATVIVKSMAANGALSGVIGIGGSGGAYIATAAMRALPIGLPKLMVTTVASSNTRPYVGESDVIMMPAVVDMTGMNRLLSSVLGRAVAAIDAMASEYERRSPNWSGKAVATTMFGVTTPAVSRASSLIRAQGDEVIVFHATGVGGRTMENLIGQGFFSAVLDITTTEIADEIGGGVCSAGSGRMRAAVAAGLPQVVSVGALDMINFWELDSVPQRYRDRRFHRHSASVTLMRTNPEECRAIGRTIGERLRTPKARTTVVFPTRGLSVLSAPGGPFEYREADEQLLEGLKETLDPSIDLVVRETAINDPALVDEIVGLLARNRQQSAS
jgi:uncharacterized protein (UPF0261 family)